MDIQRSNHMSTRSGHQLEIVHDKKRTLELINDRINTKYIFVVKVKGYISNTQTPECMNSVSLRGPEN